MTYTEQAISVAIKAGYKPFFNDNKPEPSEVMCILSDTLLDPLFFEALGRGMGWGDKDMWYETACTCGGKLHPLMDVHDAECERVKAPRGYLFQQHRLLDYIQQGKEVEEYFRGLLSKK